MLFIFIAWLLTLLTLAIMLRALHTIPIYTYTAIEHKGQKLQLKTLFIISKILLSLAFAMLLLHFILPDAIQETPTAKNGSATNSSQNSTLSHNSSF
jgi:hypothetical protein